MKNDQHRELRKEAVRRYDEAVDGDRDNRVLALDDMQFLTVTGDGHWPEEVRRERELAGKPCITVNRLPQFLRQVTGDIRRTNPAIKVVAGDAEASEEMAEIKGGMIRHIEASSSAQSIYEGAAESAAACGMGAFRVLTRYADDETFDQEIALDGIKNPFSVHWDPLAKLPTRADARFCFVTDEMDIEDFKTEYPQASTDGWDGDGLTWKHWRCAETITVAEYFWKEPVKKTITSPTGQTREIETHKIMWAKMTAREILDGPTEMPGKYIPVVAVMGEELHVGENVIRSSVIRYAKEPQQLYNYWRSAQAEVIALQPRAPFMVTPKQIQGLEDVWAKAGKANLPYLPYNPDEKANTPQRSVPPMASQAMMQEIAMAVDDLKATTGIYDAGLGNQGNEQSGVAIRQRQIEGDISTSIYVDNLAQAIEHCGRIILDLMPKIYDTTRIVAVLGADGAENLERINEVMMTAEGPRVVNDMLSGKYDVRVTTGPAYSTLRQEATEVMMQFAQATGPQVALAIGDLIAKGMDFPGADVMAERLKRMAQQSMPGVIEDGDELTPEEQQQRAVQQEQAQAEQQRQMQMQEAAFMAEMQGKAAKAARDQAAAQKDAASIAQSMAQADKTAAETGKTQVETAAAQFELALKSGLLDRVIQDAVARALSAPMGAY